MSFIVKCNICLRKFKSGSTLEKHRLKQHGRSGLGVNPLVFLDEEGRPAEPVKPCPLSRSRRSQYKLWLAAVVERVNGAHHPKFGGRWFRIDLNETPNDFFSHILWRMSVPWNAVRNMRHLRQPIIKESTLRYSYRSTDIEEVRKFLEEQNAVPLEMTAAFSGAQRVSAEEDLCDIQDPVAALEAAKRRAHQSKADREHAVVTSRSSLVVGEGSGRNTREFELQWWPSLYSTNFGKLTLRFFVGKVTKQSLL